MMGSGQDGDGMGFEPTEDLPPQRLVGGKYRLGRQLGEGAMGAVYEAEHVELGSLVAVKLLGENFAFDEVVAARARREGRAAAAIRHENIVNVLDTGVDEGIPFLVMELLEGESLGALLRRERTLSPRRAAAVLAEVLSGLAAAHEEGVLHRDLKPDNIFLAHTRGGGDKVKVLDFGVSKLAGDDDDLTEAGVALGTPHYMAPEQVARDPKLDARMDLYAAGVVLYRMLTGQLPFARVTSHDRDDAIRGGKFPPPRDIAPDVPEALERIVLRAMATSRADRYQDALAFRADLEEAVPGASGGLRALDAELTHPSTRPSATAAPTAAVGPPPRRGGLWIGALVAAVLGVVGVGLWQRADREADANPAEAAATAPAGDALVFGVSTYVPPELQAKKYAPLVEYVEAELERPVELLVTRDSAELARRFAAGEIAIAALNPLAYVRVHREAPGTELLATPVTAGGASFEVHIVARADSEIDSLDDLEGKVFCYVPSAASGYLVPRVMLRRAGVDPDHAFASTHLVADHLSALRYVDSSICDATAVYASLLFESGEHGLNPYTFRIVDTSERIPNDAYCASGTIGGDTAAKLRAALLELEPGSPLARKVFGAGDEILGFAPAADGDYDPMRAAEAEEQAAAAVSD